MPFRYAEYAQRVGADIVASDDCQPPGHATVWAVAADYRDRIERVPRIGVAAAQLREAKRGQCR